MLTKLKNPPKYFALENVIGFESSPACKNLLKSLELTGYQFMQFALSPTQFGVPNERPRYYLLAVHNGKFDLSNAQNETNINNYTCVHTSIPGLENKEINEIKSYLLEYSLEKTQELLVPENLLEKNASWCMDLVKENDKYSACFTKSYSKYFKGTGSVLLISDLTNVEDEKESNSREFHTNDYNSTNLDISSVTIPSLITESDQVVFDKSVPDLLPLPISNTNLDLF